MRVSPRSAPSQTTSQQLYSTALDCLCSSDDHDDRQSEAARVHSVQSHRYISKSGDAFRIRLNLARSRPALIHITHSPPLTRVSHRVSRAQHAPWYGLSAWRRDATLPMAVVVLAAPQARATTAAVRRGRGRPGPCGWQFCVKMSVLEPKNRFAGLRPAPRQGSRPGPAKPLSAGSPPTPDIRLSEKFQQSMAR